MFQFSFSCFKTWLACMQLSQRQSRWTTPVDVQNCTNIICLTWRPWRWPTDWHLATVPRNRKLSADSAPEHLAEPGRVAIPLTCDRSGWAHAASCGIHPTWCRELRGADGGSEGPHWDDSTRDWGGQGVAAKVQWLELAGSWPHHVLGAQRALVRDGLIRFIGGSCWFYVCLFMFCLFLYLFLIFFLKQYMLLYFISGHVIYI